MDDGAAASYVYDGDARRAQKSYKLYGDSMNGELLWQQRSPEFVDFKLCGLWLGNR